MKCPVIALITAVSLMTQEAAQGIPGWRVNPDAYARSRLTVALDQQVTHGGRASLHLLPKPGAAPGENELNAIQNVKADHYRGKRVRLSGFLRAADDARGILWLRVDGRDGGLLDIANDSSSEQAKAQIVRASTDWKRVSQVVDVPEDAIGLALGVGCQGAGQVWADDLSLELVDQTVALTGVGLAAVQKMIGAQQPNEEERKLLTARVELYKAAPMDPRNLNFEETIR